MNQDEEDHWRRDLGRLRDRLDRIERQHAEALDSLRLELSSLENRRALPVHQESVEEFQEDPHASAEPVEPAQEPTPAVAAIPPPLPVAIALEEAPSEPGPDTDGPSFEIQFGRVWLVRLGIILLITGLVLLGNFAYKNWIRELPNGFRLAGLFLCAGGLIETGRRLAAKSNLRTFGEVILAGGMAFFHYCAFAAHHVDRLRVIQSPVVAALLLLASAGGIMAVSRIRNAKATAVLGILLACYATMLQPIGWLSGVSNVLLAGAGVFLMRRPGWAGPGVAAMIGIYAAFLGWQSMGAARGDSREIAVLWFLPTVWAMFSLPALLDRFHESMDGRARACSPAATTQHFSCCSAGCGSIGSSMTTIGGYAGFLEAS